MQSTPKKVKGFTILEVIIVLSLVGIISAIGIPNFNSWNKDRVVRAEAERVRDIVTSITSQVQRGLYGFGQFQVEVSGRNVSFSTNGMLMANIATRVFVGDGTDYVNLAILLRITGIILVQIDKMQRSDFIKQMKLKSMYQMLLYVFPKMALYLVVV